MCEPTPSGTAGRCYSATTCTASRTVTRDGDGWVAYLRLEDPRPRTHHPVGRSATVHDAQLATDKVWAAR
jgi:hypothetical protein